MEGTGCLANPPETTARPQLHRLGPYHWHIPDPIRFTEDLRVTIRHSLLTGIMLNSRPRVYGISLLDCQSVGKRVRTLFHRLVLWEVGWIALAYAG